MILFVPQPRLCQKDNFFYRSLQLNQEIQVLEFIQARLKESTRSWLNVEFFILHTTTETR